MGVYIRVRIWILIIFAILGTVLKAKAHIGVSRHGANLRAPGKHMHVYMGADEFRNTAL